MKTIWRYKISLRTTQVIPLPEGAKFRILGTNRGELALWFEVDSEAPLRDETIHIYATGEEIPSGLFYLGTQILGNGTVWHAYTPNAGLMWSRG